MGEPLGITCLASVHRYSRVQSVGPIDFSVGPGEVLGLIGSNGSGKTTVMKMTLGLLRIDDGSITVRGERVAYGRLSPHMSGLIDTPNYYEHISGRDNLLLAAAGRQMRINRIDQLLDDVGLTAVGQRRVRSYSQGMRQRLGIARALLGDPEYILLDEPTNGLDPNGIRWVRELIIGLAQAGKTIVVSSHLLGELQRVSKKVAILRAGALVDLVTTKAVAAQGLSLEDIYLRQRGQEK